MGDILVAFFVLETPRIGSEEDREVGTEVIKAKDSESGGFKSCPRCGRPIGMRDWLPPHRILIEQWGKAFSDVIRLSDGIIVSDNFVNMYNRNGLVGLNDVGKVEVVRVIRRKKAPELTAPDYYWARIQYSSTTVDQLASGYVWEDSSKVCSVCLFDTLRGFQRIVINQRTWNGEDIFYPTGGTRIIVSDKFRLSCESASIRGIEFLDPLSVKGKY